MKSWTCSLTVLVIALWGGAAQAHKPSDSYLTLHQDGTRVEGQWDIALRDLDHAIGVDANGDGAITWGELRARHDAIAAYALARLELRDAAGFCTLTPREHLIDRHSDGAYAVLRFAAECGGGADTLTVRYALLFDLDPQHRGVLRIGNAEQQVFLFGTDTPEQRVVFGNARPRTLPDFWRSGIRRMADLDQLLFLAALLIPASLRRSHTTRERRPVAGSTLKTVAAFTLAHSLTLSLAALHSLSLPARALDVGIAVSVVIAASSHFSPVFARRRWMIALAFGLLHGIDLATAFSDGNLPIVPTARELLRFNVGLATGQLLFVTALLLLLDGLQRARGTNCDHRWRAELRDAGAAVVFVDRYGLAELDPPRPAVPRT